VAYDRDGDEWQPYFAMVTTRKESAGIVLSNGDWWVSGGKDENEELVQTSEVLDLDDGWALTSMDLPVPIDFHNIVQINDTHVGFGAFART